jgi:hypothetical protein
MDCGRFKKHWCCYCFEGYSKRTEFYNDGTSLVFPANPEELINGSHKSCDERVMEFRRSLFKNNKKVVKVGTPISESDLDSDTD